MLSGLVKRQSLLEKASIRSSFDRLRTNGYWFFYACLRSGADDFPLAHVGH